MDNKSWEWESVESNLLLRYRFHLKSACLRETVDRDDFHPVGELMSLKTERQVCIIDMILETHWDYFTSPGRRAGVCGGCF